MYYFTELLPAFRLRHASTRIQAGRGGPGRVVFTEQRWSRGNHVPRTVSRRRLVPVAALLGALTSAVVPSCCCYFCSRQLVSSFCFLASAPLSQAGAVRFLRSSGSFSERLMERPRPPLARLRMLKRFEQGTRGIGKERPIGCVLVRDRFCSWCSRDLDSAEVAEGSNVIAHHSTFGISRLPVARCRSAAEQIEKDRRGRRSRDRPPRVPPGLPSSPKLHVRTQIVLGIGLAACL